MYIGRMGDGSHPDDGIYVLLKEVIDNSVDEFIMGYGKRIDIKLTDKCVEVRDYGRGIPLGKVVDCVSQINTGAKYNTDVFQFSVGLNGVGTKAVNALSEKFTVISFRDGKYKRADFKFGKKISEEEGVTKEENGTYILFVPDEKIFPDYSFDTDFIKKRLWSYAYLNSGLSLYFNGEKFYSKTGLLEMIENEIGDDKLYEVIYHKEKNIEFAFTHGSNYGEQIYSFVNGQYTKDGGTHLSAFKEGIVKAINEFTGKNFDGVDVRNGIVGAIAIKIQEPVFESQTKNKLGNTDIKSWIVPAIRQAVTNFLHRNLPVSEVILKKIEVNKQLRIDIQAVKRQSKEKAKKIALRIPNLRDCKYHRGDNSRHGEETMIFLTEGQSAAGSIIHCRDVYTQAVFSLRGKPQNLFGSKFEKIYDNEELYYIMQALNIEDDIEGLRYEKVIIATDADVDGLHIRNLLISFFLTFFEQLVVSGHLFILETPIFRVRNKNKTIYCYSEKEKDNAIKELGANAEITRFKGLGEISQTEFGQFIGKDMRLIEVTVDHTKDVPRILEFYMGKNTPERRDYILQNLI
ncbi:MAG TPA: toprim domain-containing protein [Victivallales bacterium]|nr:toprim domain-containing protein [Victivallales bacterium]